MEPIVWSDRFSVGILPIDEQHQRLFDLINRVAQAPSPDIDFLVDILTEMTDYALEHFRTEEELMERYGYPGLEEHREEHRAFRRKTVDFVSALEKQPDSVSPEMRDFLTDWLQHHILEIDMQYKPFFAQHGVV